MMKLSTMMKVAEKAMELDAAERAHKSAVREYKARWSDYERSSGERILARQVRDYLFDREFAKSNNVPAKINDELEGLLEETNGLYEAVKKEKANVYNAKRSLARACATAREAKSK